MGVGALDSGHRRTSTMTWQPIDTAPKDGTDVLVYEPISGEMFVAFYHEVDWFFVFHPTIKMAVRNPTLWQPLPAPPQSNGDAP